MTAGYSGTPLCKKLGLKAGQRAYVLGFPDDYAALIAPCLEGIHFLRRAGKELDFIHFFTKQRAELELRFADLRDALALDGMLWVSWPKGSSGVPTDVTEGLVRSVGLSAGLVDVKICAVTDVWSGLKFVRRLKDREEMMSPKKS